MALLTCCRTPEELVQLQKELDQGDHGASRRIQSNLVREKAGFRCTSCGRFYPNLEIRWNGEIIASKSLSKPMGRRLKYPKTALVFHGDHYYTTNKKTLLRFDIDEAGIGVLSKEIPIMGQVWYVAVSADGRYIATETNGGTCAVLDARTGEMIAKRWNLCSGGSFRFTGPDALVYFCKGTGVCRWSFREDRETVLWQPTEEWLEPNQRPVVFCSAVLEPGNGVLVYQLGAGSWTFALVLEGLEQVKLVRLADTPALAHLAYTPELGLYTLPTLTGISIYDREFRPVDAFAYPELCKRLDGGGVFPIDEFVGGNPQRALLSPDGKWVLFDFFQAILLMERETGTLRYCVCSDNGGGCTDMGFLDSKSIWYNWGNSTYIMEISK